MGKPRRNPDRSTGVDQSKEPYTHSVSGPKQTWLKENQTRAVEFSRNNHSSRTSFRSFTPSALPWKASSLCLYFIRCSVSRRIGGFGIPDRGKGPVVLLLLCVSAGLLKRLFEVYMLRAPLEPGCCEEDVCDRDPGPSRPLRAAHRSAATWRTLPPPRAPSKPIHLCRRSLPLSRVTHLGRSTPFLPSCPVMNSHVHSTPPRPARARVPLIAPGPHLHPAAVAGTLQPSCETNVSHRPAPLTELMNTDPLNAQPHDKYTSLPYCFEHTRLTSIHGVHFLPSPQVRAIT